MSELAERNQRARAIFEGMKEFAPLGSEFVVGGTSGIVIDHLWDHGEGCGVILVKTEGRFGPGHARVAYYEEEAK
jgi:hypothetical protein